VATIGPQTKSVATIGPRTKSVATIGPRTKSVATIGPRKKKGEIFAAYKSGSLLKRYRAYQLVLLGEGQHETSAMSAMSPDGGDKAALTGDRFLVENQLMIHPHMAEVWCHSKILANEDTVERGYIPSGKPASYNPKELWKKLKDFDTKILSEEYKRVKANMEHKTETTDEYNETVDQFHKEFCVWNKGLKWYLPNDKWDIANWMPLQLNVNFEPNELRCLRPLITVLVVGASILEFAHKYRRGQITDFSTFKGYERHQPGQEDFEKHIKYLKKYQERRLKELHKGWKAVLKSTSIPSMMEALKKCDAQPDFMMKFLLHYCEHRKGKKIYVGEALDSDTEIHLLPEAVISAQQVLDSTEDQVTSDKASNCSVQ